MTKKARQRTLPEQLREHRVASTTTEITNLRIDMAGVDLLAAEGSGGGWVADLAGLRERSEAVLRDRF